MDAIKVIKLDPPLNTDVWGVYRNDCVVQWFHNEADANAQALRDVMGPTGETPSAHPTSPVE